jgi:predicted DNA binding CopG/RHH family protein
MISFRIALEVLDAIQKFAAKKCKGYQILIHDILENFVSKKVHKSKNILKLNQSRTKF